MGNVDKRIEDSSVTMKVKIKVNISVRLNKGLKINP